MITCRICQGEGGWLDPIMDDGSGPYDECGACNGEGKVGLRKWWGLLWWSYAPVWYMEFLSDLYEWWDGVRGVEYDLYGVRTTREERLQQDIEDDADQPDPYGGV